MQIAIAEMVWEIVVAIATPVTSIKGFVELLEMQNEVAAIHMDKAIYEYIAMICSLTRNNAMIDLGLSPRGAVAMAAIVSFS